MDLNKVSERTRRQLEKLPPERRAAAEAAIERTQTPEYRASEAAARDILGREYRQTGRIATAWESVPPADLQLLRLFLATLRRERENRKLSLADIADRSGIDKAALSRLENGQGSNPTISTIARYARAIGKRLRLSLEDPDKEGTNLMSLTVNISDNIRSDPQAVSLIEGVNAVIADVLGSTGAGQTTATWSLRTDDRNRPLYTLELRDPWGMASTSFAPDQIQNPEGLRPNLQRLRGNLLQGSAAR